MDPVLSALIEQWLAEDRWARVWARYPDVTPEEERGTDVNDCLPVSDRFLAEARARGLSAGLVCVEDGMVGSDEVWVHWWVRVGGVNVDWTVRQFIGAVPASRVDALGTPAVWTEPGHPLLNGGVWHEFAYQPTWRRVSN